MTFHEKAVALAAQLESDPRIKELAIKQSEFELTDDELNEFVGRMELVAYQSDLDLWLDDDVEIEDDLW